MSMTIQSSVKDKILATPSETSKVPLVGSEMDEALASRYLVHPGADKKYYNLGDMYCLRYLSENRIELPWILSLNFQDNSKEWNSGNDQLRLRWMIYLVVLADAAESVRDAIGFDNSIGPEIVQETTDKVVSIKEKFKVVRDRQKSYVGNRHKPIEFEVGDHVLLKVSPWKGVICFGKKGKLALRYVEPFEILERIGLVVYRLRLPEELSSVDDTFHVSNLKKCMADANLHVPLDEIKVDKTLCFVEEPVEIMDRGIKKLKCRKITLVKDEISSKRGYCDIRDLIRGSPTGIHGLFSGWYCGLASRKVTLGVSMAWAKGVTTGTLVRYETSRGRLLGNHVEDVDVKKSG
ncbi:hypothetical protein Tco_1237207 [Tanacetum coccineum]